VIVPNIAEDVAMVERSDLIEQAKELRQRAEHEADEPTRNRLIEMADRCDRLVKSQSWSEAHPVTVASLDELFTDRD
jgi:hypothetical protein